MTPMPLLRRAGALLLVPLAALTAWNAPCRAQSLPTGYVDQVLVSMLDVPVGLAFLPDGRLITCELKSSRLRMIVNGELAAVDPIGVVDSVETTGQEEGLLSVVADPRWPTKPYLYVLSTALDSTLRISRLTAIGDVSDGSSGNLVIDPSSRRELIRGLPNLSEYHNGGCLRVGPDSMMYASLGEDANGCAASDTTLLNGVLLRLNVRNLPDVPGPADKSLLVPADNPWATSPNLNQRLVYARGLRNPFRFSIDAPTGRIFIGDPGAQTYDEVDIADAGGLYFGWPYVEGTLALSTYCGRPKPAVMIDPIFEYARTEFCPTPVPPSCAAAVIGGVVLRHVEHSAFSIPADHDGQYLFSDYYDGFIWRLRDSLGTWVRAMPEPGQPNAKDWARGYQEVTDYVLGPDGAVYYARNGFDYQPSTGTVSRIVHPNGTNAVGDRPDAGIEFAPVYPSPAHGEATLRYVLPRGMHARLTLYDALGRRVRLLVPPAVQAAGEHRARWDGRDESGRSVSPGVYLARLVVDGQALMRRIPLVR